MRFDDDDEDTKPGDKKKKPRERARGMEEPSFDAPSPSFNDRPPRRDFGGGGGFGGGSGGFGDRPPRQYGDRPQGGGGFGDRPPRQYGDRPQGGGGFGDRPPRQYGDRPQGGGFGDRPPRQYGDRPQGGGGFGDRPPRQYGDRPQGGGGFGDRPPRRDFGGGDRGPRNFEDRAPREPLENHEGTVKFFNAERGFGFITPDGGGADVFVHISAVQRSGFELLEPDQRLAFQTLPDRFGKGPKAINLSLLDGSASAAATARDMGETAPSGDDDQPDLGDYNPE
ncbi:MAG: hypothetical protein RL230_771 [Pseudomonadota bacterium]